MNDFELTLVAALRAEAEELAMSIDQHRATDEFESRMERAHHSRRALYWAAAAVGVLVIVGAALVAVNEAGESTKVLPGVNPPKPAITYSSTTFDAPFTVTLPSWIPEATDGNPETHANALYWDVIPCVPPEEPNCSGDVGDIGLRFAVPAAIYRPDVPGPQPVPHYAGYLTFLGDLQTERGLEITDRSETTVGGRPATVMTLTPSWNVADSRFSCEEADAVPDDCWYPTTNRLLRLAVVDTGATPLVIWMAGNTEDAAGWPALVNDFSQMLGSIRLGTGPAPSAS